jgi:hypothetical protein
MLEDKKEESDFKVVDRRPFAADGTPRDVQREERHEGPDRIMTPPPSPSKSRGPSKDASSGYDLGGSRGTIAGEREADLQEDAPEGDSGFATLVSYLYTTGMFQLGLMQGPGGERIPPDLANARRTIDLLDVLQTKTRGNLTPTEIKLLEDVLYDIRMTFVDVQKQMTPKKR